MTSAVLVAQEWESLDPLRVALGFALLLTPVLVLVNVSLWYVLGRELKSNYPELWQDLVPASAFSRVKFLWSGAYLALGNRRVTVIGRSLKFIFVVLAGLFSILILSLLFGVPAG
jgi:hypothetical protein